MHGLAEIVVGADLEPDDPVDRVAAAGQDHDANLGGRSHVTSQIEAALVREAEIDNGQVEAAPRQAAASRGAIGGALDLHPLVGEVVADRRRKVGIVLNQEDLWALAVERSHGLVRSRELRTQ